MTFNHTHIPELNGKRPGTLIHLGAGRCRELDTWRQAGFHHIVLVEADPVRSAELHARIQDGDNITVIDQAVSASDGPGEFNILNYPDASSLREPGRLLELFPGIRIRKRIACQVIAIETLLSELKLDETAFNGLVIEMPGEEHALIQALIDSPAVDAISFITVQSATVPLYKGAQASHAINALLAKADFNSIATEAGDDPIRPILQFERDLAALERKRVSQELAKSKKERDALRENLQQAEAHSESVQKKFKESEQKLSDLQAERDAQKSKLEELQAKLQELKPLPDQLKKAKAESEELEKQVAELESKAAELKKVWEERRQLKRKLEESESETAEAKTRADRLEKKLDEARAENKRLSDQLATQPAMNEEIKRLFSEQAEKLDQTVKLQKETSEALEGKYLNKIISRVDNSAKQVESYIQLNSFFDRGELLPDLHGWPISPDLAVYLMRTIKQEDYDLIIEFGSGSSTVLMAQAIAQKLLGRPMKEIQGRVSELLLEGPQRLADAYESPNQAVERSARSSINGADIAPRLIAFEHMREYFEKTRLALKNAGVSDLVELAYTPLQDYQHMDGERYLYYQCDSHLQSLSSRIAADQPRILVLVDGPPGKTGQKARFPALPFVLEHFSSALVDFVLDDSDRHEEAEVLKSWEAEAEKRGYRVGIRILPFEKGAAVLELR